MHYSIIEDMIKLDMNNFIKILKVDTSSGGNMPSGDYEDHPFISYVLFTGARMFSIQCHLLVRVHYPIHAFWAHHLHTATTRSLKFSKTTLKPQQGNKVISAA